MANRVVESYKTYLEIKYPTLHQRFLKLLKHQPESARAEAYIFSILHRDCDSAIIGEDASSGGVDFICSKEGHEFLVEVTSLTKESVTAQSGWDPEKDTEFYRHITRKLFKKVSSKVDQVSGRSLPTVIIITSEHTGSGGLMGTMAAEFLLTGKTKISVPVFPEGGEAEQVTDLAESVFFGPSKGHGLEVRRRGVSSVVLGQMWGDECGLVGILHPDPEYPFPVDVFEDVPFARINPWPPERDALNVEWIIGRPRPRRFRYSPVEFSQELRSE